MSMSQAKTKISQMLYDLANDNRAAADKKLGEIIKLKTESVFEREYQKVKDTFSKENK